MAALVEKSLNLLLTGKPKTKKKKKSEADVKN